MWITVVDDALRCVLVGGLADGGAPCVRGRGEHPVGPGRSGGGGRSSADRAVARCDGGKYRVDNGEVDRGRAAVPDNKSLTDIESSELRAVSIDDISGVRAPHHERTPPDRLVKGQRGRYARRAACQQPWKSDQRRLGRMP